MRVNMDSSVAIDSRFKLVAKRLGVSRREVYGACYLLWLECYERRSERLRIAEANASAELDGFAEALIAENLATQDGDEHLLVHGVKKRIAFLESQSKKGRKGGKRSGKSRQAKPEANASARPEANASGSAQAYPLTLTPALTPAPDQDPPQTPQGSSHSNSNSGKRKKPRGSTPEELAVASRVLAKLSERAGVEYRPTSEQHVAWVVARLRQGYTELQLRTVVWHQANEWEDKPEMRKYLRPSTLFRPQKFAEYLPAAEAAWSAATRARDGPSQPASHPIVADLTSSLKGSQ